MASRHFRIEEDLSFPLDLQFTEPLDLNASLEIGGTMSIHETVEFISVRVWNPASQKIVISVWDQYSGNLPLNNFQSQKPFLQSLSDIFRRTLPRHVVNREIVSVLHGEYYRLKDECPREQFMDLERHIEVLGNLIVRVQRESSGPMLSNAQFRQNMIDSTRRRIEAYFRRSEQERFREAFYGEVPTESPPSSLTLENLEHARRVMLQACSDPIFEIDPINWNATSRARNLERLQKQNPKWKLSQLDQALKDLGHKPSLDHEASTVMPGKSKGVAGYIMLNEKLKTMLDGLCDLNRWKPDA